MLEWYTCIWLQVKKLAILNSLLANIASLSLYVVTLWKHVLNFGDRWCILNASGTFSTLSPSLSLTPATS
jgi:hypothetical protein